MNDYINGYVTSGTYFTYKGVRYGEGTEILFTKEFYRRHPPSCRPSWTFPLDNWTDHFYCKRTFNSIAIENGKEVWRFGDPLIYFRYDDVDPDRDIQQINVPVWYLTPKEMVQKRLNDGTWFLYLWPQTLFYIFCLLASLITYQWYLVWTIGTYIYLRTSYITLSKGELNRGW